MKKHLTKLLLSLLFLMVTAMTCDESDPIETVKIPCSLTDVELYHWDNAGELPQESAENRILKEAYMLEIRLLTDAGEEIYNADYYTRYVLADSIRLVQIFTETAINEKYPEGADVTSCFHNYPRYFHKNQRTDYTVDGEYISYVDKINQMFKALLTVPQPGEYRFRVVLTMKSGETVERVSEPVSLY